MDRAIIYFMDYCMNSLIGFRIGVFSISYVNV